MRKYLYLRCCHVSLLAALLLTASRCIADDEATAKAIRDGWRLNEALIGDEFLCVFSVDHYFHDESNVEHQSYRQEGIWVRSGARERYSLPCPGNELVPTDSQGIRPPVRPKILDSRCISEHMLASDEGWLNIGDFLETINIRPSGEPMFMNLIAPTPMLQRGPNQKRNLPCLIDDWLSSVSASDCDLRFEGDFASSSLVTLTTIRTELTKTGSWENRMSWTIDSDLGFQPRETVVFDEPDLWAYKYFFHYRKLSSGSYWPDEIEAVDNPEINPAQGRMVIRTTRLSFDPQVIEEALVQPVPKRIKVVNKTNMRSFFRYEGDSILPEDIGELLKRCDEQLQLVGEQPPRSRGGIQPPKPSAPPRSSLLPFALGVFVVALLVQAGLYFARRWRNR